MPELTKQLDADNHVIQQRATDAIIRINNDYKLECISNLLGHNQSEVKKAALISIESLRSDKKQVVSMVLPLLKDPDAEVRSQAAYALGIIGDRSVLPALGQTLATETSKKTHRHIQRSMNRLSK